MKERHAAIALVMSTALLDAYCPLLAAIMIDDIRRTSSMALDLSLVRFESHEAHSRAPLQSCACFILCT